MSVINKQRGSKQVPNATEYNPVQAHPQIDLKRSNTEVFHLGVKCRIYTTVPCPNVKSIDGAEHQISCPLCNGKGLVDSDTYIETMVGFLGQDRSKDFNRENIGSLWEEGSAAATFIAGINLMYYTKIELPDFSKPFYQLCQRQEGIEDRLRYRAFKVNFMIDKNGVTYTPDVDFKVNLNGWVEWLPFETGAKRPAKAVIYSISYDAMVTLRSIRALHAGRWTSSSDKLDHTENLECSENWVCRLDYLVVHENSTGAKIEPNKIFPPEGNK